MSEDNGREALFNLLGKIIAVVMLAIYAVRIIDIYVDILPAEGAIVNIINSVMVYAPLALVVATCLETSSKGSFIFRIIILAVCAAVVIFQFFPGVWAEFTGAVGLVIR